ncbi:MAG: energy transducer TonB [Pseudomonadota bacterium]
MIRIAAAAAVALLAGPAWGGDKAAPAPLAPTGKWVVDYSDNACMVSRRFGTGTAEVEAAFVVLPRSESATVAIALAPALGAGKAAPSWGRVTITLQPSGKRIRTDYVSAQLANGTRRAVSFRIWGDDVDAMIRSSRIRVDAGRLVDVVLAPRGMPAAFRAADTCKDDLLKTWNIDPVPLATAITPAKPRTPMGNWVRNADYPEKALAQRVSGTTVFRLTIDATGALTECGVIISSGSELLDTTACGLMRKRGHFLPALDANGKPVPDLMIDRFRWVIPGY